ncbi:MAG TPA: ubiquitin-like domain-containing protein [Dehalococcoidia bacterium]
MPFPSGPGAILRLARLLSEAGRQSLLIDRRRRGHAAVLLSVAVVSVFGYALLEQRTVRVLADGREVVVQTHVSNDAAVLRGVGIDVRPGDRVTALESGDIDVLQVERAQPVRVIADGSTFQLRTHAATIEQLLEEAGIAVTGRDSVLRNGVLVPMKATVEVQPLLATAAPLPSPADVIVEVRRALPFVVVEDGVEHPESTSSRPTVAQVLREANVQIGPNDIVSPDPLLPLSTSARIDVRHARAVTVALPDDHRVVYTHALTVGQVLMDENITLPDGSFVDPPEDTAITPGMSVRVVQLSASSDFEREFIESSTVYRSDPALGPGKTRTVAGHDGARVRRYDVQYVNGEEAGRELVEEYYDPEPVDTVIYYPVQTGRDLSTPEGSVVRTINVYATWYNPASSGRAASDPAYGHTATGVIVTYGVVAVDPDVIPLGTRMFIPGYGYAVAADTGGAVKGYIIDLGYPDGVAVDWRSRWLDIYILS